MRSTRSFMLQLVNFYSPVSVLSAILILQHSRPQVSLLAMFPSFSLEIPLRNRPRTSSGRYLKYNKDTAVTVNSRSMVHATHVLADVDEKKSNASFRFPLHYSIMVRLEDGVCKTCRSCAGWKFSATQSLPVLPEGVRDYRKSVIAATSQF